MATPVTELLLIYHADGGVKGELSYLWGRFRGTAHCALCDITHDTLTPSPSWKRWRDSLGIPVRTLHLNERSPDIASLTHGHTPCVVALTPVGPCLLVVRHELEECGGDVDLFAARVEMALSRLG